MKEFRINRYLSLKLNLDGITDIYVNDKKFIACKYMLLEVPIDHPANIDDIESVDELINIYENSLQEIEAKAKNLPGEVAFWGHCSNIQVWYERKYDTRILHSELAFPLLKELSMAGDPIAKGVFKEEIAKRIECGYLPVILYLLSENYIDYYLNEEEKATTLSNIENYLKKTLNLRLKEEIEIRQKVSYAIPIIRILIEKYKLLDIKNILKTQILDILKDEKKEGFNYLIDQDKIFDMFDLKEISQFLKNSPTFIKLMDEDAEIKKMFNIHLGKLKNEQKKELYEELLLILNYSEEINEIAELIKEELNFYLKLKKN